MDRIDSPTAVPDLFGPGKRGFTDGDPLAGVDPTFLNAQWFGGMQEEIMAPIEAAGFPPDPNDNNQMLAALRAMFAEGAQAFTSSGTFTVPAGITKLRVRVWGGGGGGGGALNTGCAASGGSAGGYSEVLNLSVTPGATYPVTVGAAGAAGAAGGGNGSAGGTSSFGAVCSATGGGRGFGASSGIQTTNSSPGSGIGGTLNLTGGTGSVGFITGNVSLLAGGFASMAPFGSMGNAFTVAAVGAPGNFPGGGGSGASANANGGPGAAGLVLVEW